MCSHLVQRKEQRVIVLRPEDLRHKGAPRHQQLRGQLEGLQCEGALRVRLAGPGSAHVGGAVVQDNVQQAALELPLDGGATLLGGDVLHKGDAAANGPDGRQIDAHNQAGHGHGLGRDLGITHSVSIKVSTNQGL
jgi:hypothetical protein